MKKINTFWSDVCGVCTDGARASARVTSRILIVQELAPQAISTHCFIQRYALASKTLQPFQNCSRFGSKDLQFH